MTDFLVAGCACALPWRICLLHYAQLSPPEQARVRSGNRLWSHIHDREHRERKVTRHA